MKNIYDYTIDDLKDYFASIGEKPFRATQLFEWLYKKRISSFDEITNIKKDVINKLKEDFELITLEELVVQESSDGTIKFLFGLPDFNKIETVLMRHNYGNSVCVTTQLGCNIGCSFCASGLLKKKRDLTAGEVVAQILQVQKHLDKTGERVSHIVVMGIGEPFDNYENTMKFINTVNQPKGLEIGARHITVSTSGIVPKIYEFADQETQVNLAISLHAPNDELRSQIMKINNVYPLKELMKSIEYYIDKTNRRITFEYIILDGVNDKVEHAHELSDLIRGLNAYVNIIPFNQVDESGYGRSNKERILKFYDVLKKRGINCTVRREQGHDIDAACGQLRAKHERKEA